MNICRIKQNKHGFTLAELLVVVAILMILAGVSFVAINEYIRNLQVLEMDNTAKEIFIVAQNHLSQAYASGELQRAGEDGDYYGIPISKPNYLNFEDSDDSEDTGAEYYYCHYDGYSLGSHEKTGVLSTMLPKYSIDDEIADYGNYIIVYEKNTATVQGVFYNGKSHTYFGSIKPHDFSDAEARGNDDTLEATNKSTGRDKRKHYLEDSVIGWYGADGKDIIPEKTFEPLTLRVTNGSTLKAVVTNPNYSAVNTSQVLNLIVIGLTSGKETTISLTNGAEVSFDLDDITRPKKHFCNLFPDFIPGENLRIYAKLSDTSVFAKPKYSNEEVENSLFESYSDNGSEKSIAEISNIRHLENLDYKISKLGVTVEKAEQTDNLIYSGSESFVADTNNSNKVYPHENSEPLSSNGYYSVSNDDLIEYDGQNHTISAIHAETGVNGNIGIFSETSGSASRFRLKNLTVKDSSFNGTNDTAALIGHSNNKVVINNCTVDNTVVNGANDTATFIGHSDKGVSIDDGTVTGNRTEVNSSSGNAGGLVGTCDGNLEISDSIVSGNEVIISASATNKSSGGMVGTCKGDFAITNGDVEGGFINVSSASGSSGGFIGDAAAVTFTSSFLKADTLAITGNANAGGIIGKISGVSTLSGDCFISGNLSNNPNITIKANAGNAGGVIGYSTSQLTVTGFDINGSDFASFNIQGTDSTGGNAGGIVGKAEGPLTIDTSYVIGKFLNLKANNAGGIAGSTSGNLDIKNTYTSAYVFGIGNAGGFIGSINGGTGNKIEACYASGHTKNGSYSTGTVKNPVADNYNVQSSGNSGGFIGYASSVTISNSYTTCSSYSSAAAGNAGGFIGLSGNITVNSCYSAGRVGILSTETGGKIGGFAGSGNVAGNSTAKSYFLKGVGFNEGLSAGGSGSAVSNVINTAGSEIQAASTVDDTHPWDSKLKLEGKKYKYKTTYMLSGNISDMSSHYGDWTEVEENELTLTLENAEKLTAILTVPTTDLAGIGNYASMCVHGLSSGKVAYMQFGLAQNDITWIDKSTAINNIILLNGGNTSDSEHEYLSFPEYTFPDKSYVIKNVEGGLTEFRIDLDDITTVNKNFASIFTAFKPGEDIRVTAEWGALSWNKLMEDADAELRLEASKRVPITGRTNSLFASGSGNSDYSDKSDYNDISPAVDIIDPDVSASAYSGMALITNFRHLQNLDTEVSNVTDEYSKAKILRDLYWDTTSVSGLNTIPSGELKAFVPTIQVANGYSSPIRIYSYNVEDPLTIEYKSAFYGIVNSNLKEFDGGYHSINNIFIYNASTDAATGSAGLFRSVSAESGDANSKTIKNFTIVEPVVVSEKGAVGGLIGDTGTGNAGNIKIQQVYVYGKKAIVRTLSNESGSSSKANAGGLIGTAFLGGYTIENCGASVYVYAENARCAGGFIGSLQSRDTTNIRYCFVGGHVGDGTDQVYLETDALVDGDNDIDLTVARDGGYNVVSKVAVGGFIGYLGTSGATGDIIFTECFTTASVYSPKKVTDSGDDGAAGGFIGRIQHKRQIYNSCFAEGKVWSGTDMVGMFFGQFYNGTENTMPAITDCLALTGLNFNSDLYMMYVGTTAKDAISGITAVEFDHKKISANRPDLIHTETFNKSPADFPYKDSARYKIDEHYVNVFFGDWVEPQKLERAGISNGNILKAYIYPDSGNWATELDGMTPYNAVYVRLKGKTSGNQITYRILFNDTNVIYIDDQGRRVESTTAMVRYEQGRNRIVLILDDISKEKSNFESVTHWRGLRPGEDVIMYVSDTSDGLSHESAEYATFNSLFQSIEQNADGCTAKIANSRHLMNLCEAVCYNDGSLQPIKITEAVQTDNIFWEEYNGLSSSMAGTAPFLTEIPNASIYKSNTTTDLPSVCTSTGTMMSIMNSNLRLYDGNDKIIYKIKMDSNPASATYNGLFARNDQALTIRKLKLVDPVISESTGNNAKALLVGYSGADLTIEDLNIIGNASVNNSQYSGGIVGQSVSSLALSNVKTEGIMNITGMNAGGIVGNSSGNVTMSHVGVNGIVNVTGSVYSGGAIGKHISGTLNLHDVGITAGSGVVKVENALGSAWNGAAGGLIGEISGANINIRNSYTSVYVDGYGGVGGFIGNIVNIVNAENVIEARSTGTIKNCYASGHTYGGEYIYSDGVSQIEIKNIVGENSFAVGGFIGNAAGDVTVEKCFSTNSLTSISNGYYYAGGFAGIISDRVDVVDCYSLSYLSVGIPSNILKGTFIGYVSGNAKISSCYSLKRILNTSLPAVAYNENGHGVITYEGTMGVNDPDAILGDGIPAVHHDTTSPEAKTNYPYKFWTDPSDNVSPGDTTNKYFYGDW